MQVSPTQPTDTIGMSDGDEDTTAQTALSSPVIFSDDTNTDIILRSSDDIDFHVHKAILSVVSSGFRGMFASAQPEEIVLVTESSDILYKLLRICYPAEWSGDYIGCLKEGWAVFRTAEKYGMEKIAKRLLDEVIPRFSVEDPFGLFLLSCRDDQEECAKLAAIGSLRQPLSMNHTDDSGLASISGRSYFRLLDCHRQCTGAVREMEQDNDRSWVPQDSCLRSNPWPLKGKAIHEGWWTNYVSRGFTFLRDKPLGSIIGPEFMWPSVMEASSSSSWNSGRRILEDLVYTGELMQAAVKKESMKIVEETTFCV